MRKNMTTKDKNKKDYELTEEQQKVKDDIDEQNEEIDEQLKKKDYVLTVYQTGDESLGSGDPKNMVDIRRFYAVCSLEEIPDYIKSMKTPFWTHDKGLSKKEIKNYPHEKKKWGRYKNVIIEPLSEEMEKNYLSASKEGFFESWRLIRDHDEKKEKQHGK